MAAAMTFFKPWIKTHFGEFLIAYTKRLQVSIGARFRPRFSEFYQVHADGYAAAFGHACTLLYICSVETRNPE